MVDLPAPFSPSSAWISPTSTSRLTSLSAVTPPKVFVTPVRRTANGRVAELSATESDMARRLLGPFVFVGATRRGGRRVAHRGMGEVGPALLHALDDFVGRRLMIDLLPALEQRVAGDR